MARARARTFRRGCGRGAGALTANGRGSSPLAPAGLPAGGRQNRRPTLARCRRRRRRRSNRGGSFAATVPGLLWRQKNACLLLFFINVLCDTLRTSWHHIIALLCNDVTTTGGGVTTTTGGGGGGGGGGHPKATRRLWLASTAVHSKISNPKHWIFGPNPKTGAGTQRRRGGCSWP